MRTTLTIADDALLVAKHLAARERLSLGDAVSMLIREGARAHAAGMSAETTAPLRGRYALLPARDEVITIQHVRDLMEREGI